MEFTFYGYNVLTNRSKILKIMKSMYILRKPALIIAGAFIIISMFSCKRFVVANPPANNINSANVFASDATAIAAITSLYINMSSGTSPGSFASGRSSLSYLLGLASDELTLYSGVSNTIYNWYYTNALSNVNTGSDFWKYFYSTLFTINSSLDGISKSTGLSPTIKLQLEGEAKFMRALCYFYLVNLYGDVPLVIGADYTINDVLPRTPKIQIWQQIKNDLLDAKNELSPNYLDATLMKTTTERVRPSQWAAIALLARVYLYMGDWANAEIEASSLINNTSLFKLSTVDSSFLKSSLGNNEAIWQLQPVTSSPTNTQDGYVFILSSTGPNTTNSVYLNNNLVNSFEAGDLRKISWTSYVKVGSNTYYFPNKYKVNILNAPVREYSMVFRLGEQYLIRAEARAQQGNISGAQSDLNIIRVRAGLSNTTSIDQTSLLSAILRERRMELFTEWGHRWLDLKRLSMIDAVMGNPGGACTAKGGTWNTNSQWFPIPLTELQHDPNLVQNSGY
jgi:hypothetical protein